MSDLPSIDEVIASHEVPAEENGVSPSEGEIGNEVEEAVEGQNEEVVEEDNQTEEEVVPEEPAPKKDLASSRFAALARKEKEARQKAKEAEERARQIEEKERQLREQEEKTKSFAQKIKENPLAAMEEYGLTYADLTKAALGQYEKPEPDPLDEKLSPFDQKIQELQKTNETLLQKLQRLEQDSARNAYMAANQKIQEAIDVSGAEYTKTMGEEGLQLVRNVITEYWQKEQKALDFSEAVAMVEEYYDDYFGRLLETSKAKGRLGTLEQSSEEKKPTPKKEVKGATTLKNAHSKAPSRKVDINSLPKDQAIEELAKRIQFVSD